MATLFQVHANMKNLKTTVKELAELWSPGDSILLLGETAGYIDWFKAYVDDINVDDEFENEIREIQVLYVLSDDINSLNDSAKLNLNLDEIKQLTDSDWVILTQNIDRIVTLAN